MFPSFWFLFMFIVYHNARSLQCFFLKNARIFIKPVIMRSCVSAHAYYFNCMRAFLMYFNIFLSFFDDHAVKHPPPFSTISTYCTTSSLFLWVFLLSFCTQMHAFLAVLRFFLQKPPLFFVANPKFKLSALSLLQIQNKRDNLYPSKQIPTKTSRSVQGRTRRKSSRGLFLEGQRSRERKTSMIWGLSK